MIPIKWKEVQNRHISHNVTHKVSLDLLLVDKVLLRATENVFRSRVKSEHRCEKHRTFLSTNFSSLANTVSWTTTRMHFKTKGVGLSGTHVTRPRGAKRIQPTNDQHYLKGTKEMSFWKLLRTKCGRTLCEQEGAGGDGQPCVSLNHPLNQRAAAARTQKVVCLWHCLVDSDGSRILWGFVVVFFPLQRRDGDTSRMFDGLGGCACCDRQSRGGQSWYDWCLR